MSLQKFSKGEILINKEDAYKILSFFFPPNAKIENSEQLTDEDVAFAQSLIKEAIDQSYKMSYAEALFKSLYSGRMPFSFSRVQNLVLTLCKGIAKNWLKHKTTDKVEIYGSVRATISRNFKSVWEIRIQTGDLDY